MEKKEENITYLRKRKKKDKWEILKDYIKKYERQHSAYKSKHIVRNNRYCVAISCKDLIKR